MNAQIVRVIRMIIMVRVTHAINAKMDGFIQTNIKLRNKPMSKYRKKPVVIEAIQWKGNNFNEIVYNFVGIICGERVDGKLDIKTLEGITTADINDYVIRGIVNEFYACKPDIFKASYELLEEQTNVD